MTREEAIHFANCLKKNYTIDFNDMEEFCDMAIKALEQEPCTLDDAREDFVFDIYKILDFLPTNNEANQIIDVFDRVTSGLEKEPILDKVRAEIDNIEINGYVRDVECFGMGIRCALNIIDKYKAESEE